MKIGDPRRLLERWKSGKVDFDFSGTGLFGCPNFDVPNWRIHMDNFDIRIEITATNRTTKLDSVTTQTYPDASYSSLVAVQEAIANALINLGKARIAAGGK